MKSLTLALALAVGTVLALGTPAWSDKKKEQDGDVAALVKDAKITIDQAIKTAVEKEVEIVGADGKVTEVCIDAVTGAVLDTESKDKKDEKKKEGKKGK
jgi:uncharacterized membrane protein YkoI